MNTKAIGAQTKLELAMTLRRGESLLVTLAIPIGILVFFGKVDALTSVKGDPIDFLVPGVLGARGHGQRDGEPRHRDRFRATVRRAEAIGIHAVVARWSARGQDAQRARDRGAPGRRDHRHGVALGWKLDARMLPRSACC